MNSKAQIVATIGPASSSREVLRDMISHNMDVARLNFSWGSHKDHEGYIDSIREISKELNKNVKIIQDLSGPRVQSVNKHGFDSSKISVLTEKDIEDVKFGLSKNVDYVAMSFVGNAQDIKNLKDEINKNGKNTKVIAKIERKIALDNIDEIISVSDAIMIARGDLGNEVPIQSIPFIERYIIKKCKDVKKPVITATEMLLSMTSRTVPTRAEVTDVAFAIISGSDAVMLSEETANGKNPVEAVKAMESIILEAEKHLEYLGDFNLLK